MGFFFQKSKKGSPGGMTCILGVTMATPLPVALTVPLQITNVPCTKCFRHSCTCMTPSSPQKPPKIERRLCGY